MTTATALERDSGASAVEYGLLVSAIAGVIALVVFALGVVTQEAYQDSCSSIKATATSLSGTC
jgi:pilus assembly protein Flp/PilA